MPNIYGAVKVGLACLFGFLALSVYANSDVLLSAAAPPPSPLATSVSLEKKIKITTGIFWSRGSFRETDDEPQVDFIGYGLYGDFNREGERWSVRLDLARTLRETGSGALVIKNTFTELRAWGLWSFRSYRLFSIYGGLGAGIVSPDTTMTILNSSKFLRGQNAELGGVLLGLHWALPRRFGVDAWTQQIYASVYPTGRVFSYSLALGYQF